MTIFCEHNAAMILCAQQPDGYIENSRPPVPTKSAEYDLPLIMPQCTISFSARNARRKNNVIHENRKRPNRHQLRLSDDEEIILQAKYECSGMKSVNAYIIHLIKYGFSFDVDYTELHRNNVELGRIARSLNQIAARTNATGRIYEEDIEEMKELLRKTWQLQESILSKQPYRKQ